MQLKELALLIVVSTIPKLHGMAQYVDVDEVTKTRGARVIDRPLREHPTPSALRCRGARGQA